jgi:hypothetical protein
MGGTWLRLLMIAVVGTLAGCAAAGAPGGSSAPPEHRTISAQPAPTGSTPARSIDPEPYDPIPVRPPPSPPVGTGIFGVTTVDGGCPVVRADQPCPDRPISARITVTQQGTTVASLLSAASGAYRVALPPGTYLVRATNASGSALPRPVSASVTVQAGRYTPLNLRMDSGIR